MRDSARRLHFIDCAPSPWQPEAQLAFAARRAASLHSAAPRSTQQHSRVAEIVGLHRAHIGALELDAALQRLRGARRALPATRRSDGDHRGKAMPCRTSHGHESPASHSTCLSPVLSLWSLWFKVLTSNEATLTAVVTRPLSPAVVAPLHHDLAARLGRAMRCVRTRCRDWPRCRCRGSALKTSRAAVACRDSLSTMCVGIACPSRVAAEAGLHRVLHQHTRTSNASPRFTLGGTCTRPSIMARAATRRGRRRR